MAYLTLLAMSLALPAVQTIKTKKEHVSVINTDIYLILLGDYSYKAVREYSGGVGDLDADGGR